MHIHILGVGGSFMAGLAMLGRALGHTITGSDAQVYPPASTQLAAAGIDIFSGYSAANLKHKPDVVVIGNALSRGNPEVEAVLDQGLPYTSGAQWVAENILHERWVIAVAGTHGKTTTASMIAWILEYAGLDPGFLIGGVPCNFDVSARLRAAPFFVIEADEYDTAFFDKRSKFIHYRPRTAILNNLEFDHADIFPDLPAIQRQFHYFVRTVPASGRFIVNAADRNLTEVLEMGCWSPVEYFDATDGWSAKMTCEDAGRFHVLRAGAVQGEVSWKLIGRHNMSNALAAIAAVHHAGVSVEAATEALCKFENVRRRLEVRGTVHGITVYDDFAHHPTEIAASLRALRSSVGKRRIFAVLEPRSNSMRMGVHQRSLAGALVEADQVLILRAPEITWDVAAALNGRARVLSSVDAIIATLVQELQADDRVLIMSNGDFGGLHDRLLARLQS
ncbi:MAG: UDP-N-acetylmuramate:L-alanyl-gamma-D-glutamyl-meso-diaminopimelate ligase [Acidiferrobacterales bacterium]